MRYQCPVCGYAELPYPPRDYHICPCCGTEFGNDDAELTHAQIREMWVAAGARWFFRTAPAYWNPYLQLVKAGFNFGVPKFVSEAYFQNDSTVVSNGLPTGTEQGASVVRQEALVA